MNTVDVCPVPVPPSRLGESPLWHPAESRLYWCDIAAHELHRYDPDTSVHEHWVFDSEPSACAPMLGGGLLLAMRDGLWRFDTEGGRRTRLAEPPYDPAVERFNDGKADAWGRFWVGTIFEPREPALAALYCFDAGHLERRADGITVSNGLAWSPDGRTMYWSDTKVHAVYAMDYDLSSGAVSRRRLFAQFASRVQTAAPAVYGGRPDGAAIDAEGCYWVAMYEGARLLRLSPSAEVLLDLALPLRCPTMPCFGGSDLKTLYLTSAREARPASELVAMPLSGCVMQLRVEVPGLPVNFARLSRGVAVRDAADRG